MRNNRSRAEQAVLDKKSLQEISRSVAAISTKATEIESMVLNSGNLNISELRQAIDSMANQINILEGFGRVIGGNIYIQDTQPSEPQDNDIWFDIGSIV